jgi:hypothetical protein
MGGKLSCVTFSLLLYLCTFVSGNIGMKMLKDKHAIGLDRERKANVKLATRPQRPRTFQNERENEDERGRRRVFKVP